MTPSASRPRLALARPAQHPLAETVRKAGWTPVPYAFTALKVSTARPPLPFETASAVILLSPSGARVAARRIPAGTVCLVQGAGTAEALGREDVDLRLPSEARAEALWDLVKKSFPNGGAFILARGERSREYLEAAAQSTPWHMYPWVTHSEGPREPFPPLPKVEAVLALSPLQAEILAPITGEVLRFAWGDATRDAFARCGAPAHAHCEPKPGLLWAMLAQHLNKEESPC